MIKQFEYPKLRCKSCEDIIYSKQGGDWVSCSCWADEIGNKGVYMDRDRWKPERFRIGFSAREDFDLIEERGINQDENNN